MDFRKGKIKIYLTWTGLLMEGHFAHRGVLSVNAILEQLSARGNVVKTNFVAAADALYFGATLENTLGSQVIQKACDPL